MEPYCSRAITRTGEGLTTSEPIKETNQLAKLTMIIDTLDNLEHYEPLNRLIAKVVAFIREHDLNKLPAGKYPIAGDDAYVNIQTATGRTEDEAVIEYHHKMIDIQIPLGEDERYGYTPLADLPAADFDEKNDCALMPGIHPQTVLNLRKGQFVIFTPQDGHAPCISDLRSFKKAIFKIKA